MFFVGEWRGERTEWRLPRRDEEEGRVMGERVGCHQHLVVSLAGKGRCDGRRKSVGEGRLSFLRGDKERIRNF